MEISHLSKSINERFWSKVEKTDGCWLWRGGKDSRGYGMLFVCSPKRPERAHRIAYRQAYGDIPKGMDVCHSCDNPTCVRPDHLFLGTRKDNLQDASRKGRTSIGERNGNARLTKEKAIEMRHRRNSGQTISQISHDFNVSDYAVRMATIGRTWKHIPLDL